MSAWQPFMPHMSEKAKLGLDPEYLLEWQHFKFIEMHPQERAKWCNRLWADAAEFGVETKGIEDLPVADQIMMLLVKLQIRLIDDWDPPVR